MTSEQASMSLGYSDALRALAATTDGDLVPDEAHFDDLFERGILKTERNYCDEYQVVLTPDGRKAIRELVARASAEAEDC